jgi:D-alanine-D-alanine ligase
MTQKKLRIGVVFGGRSCEHEVSLASATSVMANLDRNKYDIVPIAITKKGAWLLGVEPAQLQAAESGANQDASVENATAVTLTIDPRLRRLIPVQSSEASSLDGVLNVIFPVLHGPYGEDGTLQGLLDMANLPYVGCGVLGSALGMDKEKMKQMFRAVGLPVVDSLSYRRSEWERAPEAILDAIEQRLNYPCFVKPANLGSSVGVNKARNRAELEHALQVATEYDHKIIIERGLNCREFSCAVLGNDTPSVSVLGEMIPGNEFSDYNDKYINHKLRFIIPSEIAQATADEVRHQAVQAYLALDLEGLARVDFFLDQETGQFYINEVNTMPGFTQISLYPKLWAASGLPYPQLLDRLIELALERYEYRQRNRTNL